MASWRAWRKWRQAESCWRGYEVQGRKKWERKKKKKKKNSKIENVTVSLKKKKNLKNFYKRKKKITKLNHKLNDYNHFQMITIILKWLKSWKIIKFWNFFFLFFFDFFSHLRSQDPSILQGPLDIVLATGDIVSSHGSDEGQGLRLNCGAVCHWHDFHLEFDEEKVQEKKEELQKVSSSRNHLEILGIFGFPSQHGGWGHWRRGGVSGCRIHWEELGFFHLGNGVWMFFLLLFFQVFPAAATTPSPWQPPAGVKTDSIECEGGLERRLQGVLDTCLQSFSFEHSTDSRVSLFLRMWGNDEKDYQKARHTTGVPRWRTCWSRSSKELATPTSSRFIPLVIICEKDKNRKMNSRS